MKFLRQVQIWGRLTLPPDWILGALTVLYVVVEVVFVELIPRPVVVRPGDFVIGISAVLYGLFRGAGFHPAFHADYRRWLAATPWTNRLPLPVGPVHLVPQDVLVLASLTALGWVRHPILRPEQIPLTFLFAYEAMLGMSFVALRMVWYAYALAFGLGLVAFLHGSPIVALAVATALYSMTFVGLRQALDNFENWELHSSDQGMIGARSIEKRIEALRQRILGYPFDNIGPADVAPSIRYRDGLMISLLFGWWTFVLIPWAVPRQVLFMPIGICAFVSGLLRLNFYASGYSSPISFWGRLFTLRWIIPGYDKIFLAPLAAVILASLGADMLFQLPVHPAATAAVTVSLTLAAVLNFGPTLTAWRLTGKHRLSPRQLMASKRAEVKEI